MLKQLVRKFVLRAADSINYTQSDASLQAQSHRWWTSQNNSKLPLYRHWRDSFDEPTWNAIGSQTLDLYHDFAGLLKFELPAKRVLEWGCGGGANAIHFAMEAEVFYGIDVAEETLSECQRQLSLRAINNMRPILVDTQNPEEALQHIREPIDLFLCVYVFEVFPSKAYGTRILKIASEVLRSGGLAFVQIKYPVDRSTQSRRWGYRFAVSNMTSYPVHEFWDLCKTCGLNPHAVHLMPKQPLVRDERYAYFFLKKN